MRPSLNKHYHFTLSAFMQNITVFTYLIRIIWTKKDSSKNRFDGNDGAGSVLYGTSWVSEYGKKRIQTTSTFTKTSFYWKIPLCFHSLISLSWGAYNIIRTRPHLNLMLNYGEERHTSLIFDTHMRKIHAHFCLCVYKDAT